MLHCVGVCVFLLLIRILEKFCYNLHKKELDAGTGYFCFCYVLEQIIQQYSK